MVYENSAQHADGASKNFRRNSVISSMCISKYVDTGILK